MDPPLLVTSLASQSKYHLQHRRCTSCLLLRKQGLLDGQDCSGCRPAALRSTDLVGLLKELRLCTAISAQRNLRRSLPDPCCGLEDIRNWLILLFANVRLLYLS